MNSAKTSLCSNFFLFLKRGRHEKAHHLATSFTKTTPLHLYFKYDSSKNLQPIAKK